MRFTPPDEDWSLSNTYWIVVLSDDRLVYQDYKGHYESWLSLKQYLIDNNLRIKKIILKFRSNEVHVDVPDYTSYVYMSNGVGRWSTVEKHERFIIIGIQYSPTQILKHWFIVPELVEHRTTTSDIDLSLEAFCYLPTI